MGKVTKKYTVVDSCTKYSGSITVFLTILFLLFFSLIGVTLGNVRILSSEGYMRVASHSAAMTVFGSYNRELYQDYGLFAYGGCDGQGIEDLAAEFTDVLIENIRFAPEYAEDMYGNLYRFSEVEGEVVDAGLLVDSEIFLEQIGAYLKSAAVQDLTEEIKSKVSGNVGEGSIQEKLALTKEYEEGKFDASREQKAGGIGLSSRKSALEGDVVRGNPLEIFTDIMRDGILNLVCSVKDLSDGIIPDSNGDESSESDSGSGKSDGMGAADYLRSLLSEGLSGDDMFEESDQAGSLDNSDEMEEGQDKNVIEDGIDKAKYICYAAKQFSSYTEDKKRTTKYGLEYLAAGKREEKECLAHIVNRILVLRLLLNFGCIVADPALQEKSLATATILAGFIGLPPVISAVQYTILLILAFEEACVDLIALLEGRWVPVIKGVGDLKMRYEEICLASKSLFAAKAKEYSGDGRNSATDITYSQYLWFFLLGQSGEMLQNRIYDLIQYDLREKYNQTFLIRTCICRSRYQVRYQMPFLFQNLPYLNGGKDGMLNIRKLEVDYEYKSR